ncbi:hypothetical protein BaRGS_00004336 [Batillaria attramentaria]|uniref:PIPK domain-containing protein n=1 Tax=Batillaria attramentaria TaxID=370345 RepID=A0ABD0LXV0_9CAEN
MASKYGAGEQTTGEAETKKIAGKDERKTKDSSEEDARGEEQPSKCMQAPDVPDKRKNKLSRGAYSTSQRGEEPSTSGEHRAKPDRKFKYRHHSLWYRLRGKHNHTGVIELDPRHPLHPSLEAMSVGIRRMMLDRTTPGPKDTLVAEDFESVITQQLFLSSLGVECTFQSFATAVFATIRRAVDIDDNLYFNALANPAQSFLEFISNSRSGQDFFLSHDKRYLIKTNTRKDVKFFLSIIAEYLQHFVSYPHSLLVKYIGCYSIKLPHKRKVYFLVMQNIFYPPDRIEDRFDVKGCTAGRYQRPSPPGSHAINVLKDQNFFQEELELGTQKEWFLDQIKADTTFLRNLNVMDYSLLVARQKLHLDERNQTKKLPVLISRINKSLRTISVQSIATADTSWVSTSSSSPERQLFLPTDQQKSRSQCNFAKETAKIEQHGVSFSIELPGLIPTAEPPAPNGGTKNKSSILCFPQSLQECSESHASFETRRRLLPNCQNALHIIDGPNYRYFLGIVDFLTQWNLKQKAARLWKIVKYGCGEHSTMPPPYYSRRFVSFIQNRVT